MRTAAGIIPVRYQSNRFPGKPLAPILGKPMIQWVYEGAKKSRLLRDVIIATDDERIFDAARKFGAPVAMTSPVHISGTERVAEVAQKIDESIIVNIQGDEPLVEGEMIDKLVEALQDDSIPMASLMTRVSDLEKLHDRNNVKVVVDRKDFALYFSRSPLPSGVADFFFLHIGIYGYQREFLFQFCRLPPSRLEGAEKLEQLRALENGYGIKMMEILSPTLSVDVPQDIINVEKALKKRIHE